MLQAVDIRTVWERVYPGIQKIHSELPWNDWRVEDIYAACLSGQAAILIQPDTEPQDAFLIAKQNLCEQTRKKSLFIWIAWSKNDEQAKDVYKDLDMIAMESGCESINFMTGSQKLVKYAQSFGYKKVMYEVRKEIAGKEPISSTPPPL